MSFLRVRKTLAIMRLSYGCILIINALFVAMDKLIGVTKTISNNSIKIGFRVESLSAFS